MSRWLYVVLHLLFEGLAARHDARVRFLQAQVEILRRKLGGKRVVPSPADRARLLAIGQELDHNVAGIIGIVTPRTYCRWVRELRQGHQPKRAGRPKIARNLREFVVRLARENPGWGHLLALPQAFATFSPRTAEANIIPLFARHRASLRQVTQKPPPQRTGKCAT